MGIVVFRVVRDAKLMDKTCFLRDNAEIIKTAGRSINLQGCYINRESSGFLCSVTLRILLNEKFEMGIYRMG